MEITPTYTGYRSEDYGGSGVRDLLSVLNFEVQELGNAELVKYLRLKGLIKYPFELKELIDDLYSLGYDEAVWLVDELTDLYEIYFPDLDSENLRNVFVDKITIKNGIILLDIKGGKLIAYCPQDIEIKDVDTDKFLDRVFPIGD